ncbi:MAG: hypothetical protein AKCLJLPJ_01831 [Fimbriimonadales bacterium]|nr:hypothetical protein [Fimbriimonadales bacterium]
MAQRRLTLVLYRQGKCVENRAGRYHFRRMRNLGILLGLAFAASAHASVTLVPLDSRPATGQYPQMLGHIAGERVSLPPTGLLGRFTEPGKAEAVCQWLLAQDLSESSSLVISADMLAYGGLVESRLPTVSVQKAIERIGTIRKVRAKWPGKRLFVFSSLMRTAPTATSTTASWRMHLARYVELKERYQRTGERFLLGQMESHRSKFSSRELEKYYAARKRNMEVHKALIKMVKEGAIDYLVIGVDDAQKYGPHVPETKELRSLIDSLSIGGLVYICDGVDQLGNLLVSRALLREAKWMPQVYVRFSDPAQANKAAPYETRPLAITVRDQIIVSGARPAASPDSADFQLYLNAPGADAQHLDFFALTMLGSPTKTLMVAVADVNFSKDGAADPQLVSKIWKSQNIESLLAFAGWNTASNTIGTSVPHANLYLLSKRLNADAFTREKAHREFLFHRFINDYAFHRFVRPAAYRMADSDPSGSREELSASSWKKLEQWVARNTEGLIVRYFEDLFRGEKFWAQEMQYEVMGISGIEVSLPWPRVFEARIAFDFVVSPVVGLGSGGL